jgi:hypothetical protein
VAQGAGWGPNHINARQGDAQRLGVSRYKATRRAATFGCPHLLTYKLANLQLANFPIADYCPLTANYLETVTR